MKLKSSNLKSISQIIYGYSKSDASSREFLYEREPSRILKIQQPELYRGELGAQKSSQWRQWDRVWIVNGHIEKADANFLGELFYTRIGDTRACLGTYPASEEEVRRLQ